MKRSIFLGLLAIGLLSLPIFNALITRAFNIAGNDWLTERGTMILIFAGSLAGMGFVLTEKEVKS